MIDAGHELWDALVAPNETGYSWVRTTTVPTFEELLTRAPGMIADGLRFLPDGAAIAWGRESDGQPVFQVTPGTPTALQTSLNGSTRRSTAS
jgi:hypothetical protein